MSNPTNLKYTKDHEWALAEGNVITVGITDHAQSALGDIVYCELPPVGRELKAGDTFGVVESIKAVSDLYSPVSGKVTAVNSALTSEPSQINSKPYESWMIKVELSNGDTHELMDAAAYTKHVENSK